MQRAFGLNIPQTLDDICDPTRLALIVYDMQVGIVKQIENGRQITGKLHQLSVTGGLVEIAMYLEERSQVGLAIPIGASLVRPDAELLFPMRSARGYLQPFRFTRLWTEERQMLETEISDRLKQTVARTAAGQGKGFGPRSFYLESF